MRIEGIDAPELGQLLGKASKEAMGELVFDKDVELHITGKDRYGRTLAVVLVAGVNVNLELSAPRPRLALRQVFPGR